MQTLFLFLDNSTNGYNVEFLAILSFIAILCGIFVIISKNPIISVLFLIGLFVCISSYLFFLGINFIGLSYLLVYIGAVSILFLFILMLINIRISELQTENSNSLPLAIITYICLFSILYEILPFETTISSFFNNERIFNLIKFFNNNEKVPYVISQLWDGNLAETLHITSIGNILYTNYFMWLIITSIILLLAMTGVIIITLRSPDESPNYSSYNLNKS